MFGILSAWIITLFFSLAEPSNVWSCKNGYCQESSSYQNDKHYPSQQVCELVCSSSLNLWPRPTGYIASVKELINIDSRSISFFYNGPDSVKNFLYEIAHDFTETLEDSTNCPKVSYPMKVSLHTSEQNMDLNLNTDESYSLLINFKDEKISVNISGVSVYGVRHGMETLFQLIIPYGCDEDSCLTTLTYVDLLDEPVFRHRGLLIDTARNFLSVDEIKRNLDGMASSKLNVLHWHITDTQSFPLEISRLPNMTKYGAYGKKKIYTRSNISDLVSYAKKRGVRILLEIDGPSHAGNGWQWGSGAGLGNLAVCVNKQPWRSYCIQPPCGQLNPANPNLYKVARDLYKDIVEMFPDTGVFHMGGDEVFIPCWNSSQEILDFLKGKPLTEQTFLDLWATYQSQMTTTYDSAIGHDKTSIVVWTSHLTEPDVITQYLPNDRYIIQTWIPEANNSLLKDLVHLGYRLVISTKDKWYLDHGFWGSTKYYKWQTVYNNVIYPGQSDLVLGGEVCMWGELVDDNNIEQKIWPRTAAAAERLWSNPTSSAEFARYRFYAQRERLVKIGLHPEAVIPRWCFQNPGECQSYM